MVYFIPLLIYFISFLIYFIAHHILVKEKEIKNLYLDGVSGYEIEKIKLPDYFIDESGRKIDTKKLTLFRAIGHSLEPEIENRDLVFMERGISRGQLKYGDILVTEDSFYSVYEAYIFRGMESYKPGTIGKIIWKYKK